MFQASKDVKVPGLYVTIQIDAKPMPKTHESEQKIEKKHKNTQKGCIYAFFFVLLHTEF